MLLLVQLLYDPSSSVHVLHCVNLSHSVVAARENLQNLPKPAPEWWSLRRRGKVTLRILSSVNRFCKAFSSSSFLVPGSACKKPLLMLVVLLID
ncbi:hypothetical protein Bca4012_025032 [Brassica carinata]